MFGILSFYIELVVFLCFSNQSNPIDIFFQKEKTTAYTIPDALLFFLPYSKFFPLIRSNDFIKILSPFV